MRGGSRWWTATIIALDAPVMLIVLMAYTDDTIQAVATAVIFVSLTAVPPYRPWPEYSGISSRPATLSVPSPTPPCTMPRGPSR